MGEIVNLRRVKKSRDRAEADAKAASNRALHGQTLAERKAAAATRALHERVLDGAALDPKRQTGEA